MQTNFYAQNHALYNVYNGTFPVPAATTSVHLYGVEWTPEYLAFFIDGKQVRKTYAKDARDGKDYPQTPMQVRLGTWVAGSSTKKQGTIDWGGGMADFSTPKRAYFRSMKITDYCGGYTGGKEYVYGDNSGKWQSIQVVGGVKGPGFGKSSPVRIQTEPPTTRRVAVGY